MQRVHICTSWRLGLNGACPRLDQQQQMPGWFCALFMRLLALVVVLSLIHLALPASFVPHEERGLKSSLSVNSDLQNVNLPRQEAREGLIRLCLFPLSCVYLFMYAYWPFINPIIRGFLYKVQQRAAGS